MYRNSNLKLFFNNSHILKYSDLSINISDIYIYRSIFRIGIFFTGRQDPIELLDRPGYQRHHRLYNWTDVNASDIKIFLAHVIAVALVRKLMISKYWRCNSTCSTPFFSIHLTRPQFERILVNLHVNNNTRANTDPLCKIRPVVGMVDRNFLHVYTPKKIYISG